MSNKKSKKFKKSSKPKKVAYEELERMLYELYEHPDVDYPAVDAVKGLHEWMEAENHKRNAKREKLKKNALAKLTEAEREVLGFPSAESVDDE